MNWNRHFQLAGTHALLSASKHSWLNYDDDKVLDYLRKQEAARRGTRLHAFANEAILLGQRLPDNRRTINRYVNDAIGFRMTPELTLAYSANCYGTPDAISWRERSDGVKFLRISDLKTGESPSSVKQLLVYAALFFLEYGDILMVEPNDVVTELRIYQSDDVELFVADPADIMWIMGRIIHIDAIIEANKEASR